MEPRDYVTQAGLDTDISTVRDAQRQLWGVLADSRERSVPAIPSALDRYYKLKVPKLSADGSCSLPGELEATPYDLASVMGGRDARNTASLLTLESFLEFMLEQTGADWLGIYQVRTTPRGLALVKISSKGAPSRAEFPLTPDFAQRSNVVDVALSGKARVIADVAAHVKGGGRYYECDPKVQSEACLPLLDPRGVLGVLDAESTRAKWFDAAKLGWLAALTLELPPVLPPGGAAAPR